MSTTRTHARSSRFHRRGVRYVVTALVPLAVLATGCGDADSTATAQDVAPAEADQVSNGSALPQDAIALQQRAGASEAELDCIAEQADVPAALGCLDLDTLVASQRIYLEENTDATPEQIDCVATALQGKGVEATRQLADSGIGQAVYVPCGLPD